jgi:hypothetical protein
MKKVPKKERDINYSDIPATTRLDWRNAIRGKFYRPNKSRTS